MTPLRNPKAPAPGGLRAWIVRLFAGGLTGLCLALLASRSVWLEMRVNVGHFIPLCMLIALVLGSRLAPRRGFLGLLALQAVAAVLLAAFYAVDLGVLGVVPATFAREGLFIGDASLGTVNLLLAGALVLGNLAALTGSLRRT